MYNLHTVINSENFLLFPLNISGLATSIFNPVLGLEATTYLLLLFLLLPLIPATLLSTLSATLSEKEFN